MNNKKKWFALFVCVVMCFVMACPAMAAYEGVDLSQYSHIGVGINDNQIMPFANTACSGGNGRCEMLSTGDGFIWDVDKQEFVVYCGACWQCKNCMLVMVTEGDPLCGQVIGKYAILPVSYEINYHGAVIDAHTNKIYYSSASGAFGMDGIHFTYR